MKKSIILSLIILFTTVTAVNIVLATRPPIIPNESAETLAIPHPVNAGTPEENFLRNKLIPDITRTIIALGGGLAFLFVIIGGIQILTAYGNDEKVGNGKKTITYALVGMLIAILSYSIVSIISALQLDNPPPTTESSIFQIKTAYAQSIVPKIEYPKEAINSDTEKIESSKIAMISYLPSGSWQTILGNAIKIILGICGSLTAVALTYGGVMMIMAKGDEGELTKAKAIMSWSIIALILIAGSYALVLGISQLKIF